jgi:hypothetical protein
MAVPGNSQKDSLIFRNKNAIVGEIKSMDKGVLVFETDYSDSDFKIEWKELYGITTESYLYVSLSNGKNCYGNIRSRSDTLVTITSHDSTVVNCRLEDIVHVVPIKYGFKDRFSAEIDLGSSLTKANNQRQLTLGSKVGYKTEKWNGYISLNALRSIQDEADPIRRTESDFVFRYLIYKNWYLIPSAKYLSNTEQDLRYRWNGLFGIGNYIIRNSTAYWGILIGINRNREKYTKDAPENKSWEGCIGTELNLFDLEDLDLFFKTLAYPSLTELGRWRCDGNLNIKYDLPLDFYVKLESSVNYDSQPSNAGSKSDFVVRMGFG